MKRLFLLATLLGCTLLSARPSSGYYSPEMDELRIELEEIKKELHSTRVELSLLEERQKKQGTASKAMEPSVSASIHVLEKKLTSAEAQLEKLSTDLRSVTTQLNQTLNQVTTLEHTLARHDSQFSEMGKLKGTLTSLSKAMQHTPPPLDAMTYEVKAGDSLEKIARLHHTTVQQLRKLNHLSSDKIVIGQQLQVGNE